MKVERKSFRAISESEQVRRHPACDVRSEEWGAGRSRGTKTPSIPSAVHKNPFHQSKVAGGRGFCARQTGRGGWSWIDFGWLLFKNFAVVYGLLHICSGEINREVCVVLLHWDSRRRGGSSVFEKWHFVILSGPSDNVVIVNMLFYPTAAE